MAARLLCAAQRLQDAEPAREAHTLREDQSRVFSDFSDFLLEVATHPGDAVPYGRIILPPRTGKTIIAGHIISRTELTTTFLVPTRTLVQQTARELSAQLPGVAIGVYFGERKDLVDHGVNVTTYQILQRALAAQALPPPIASAALVFVDEAHHSMTLDRVALLQRGFLPGALRVALTATPDYDERRVLCRHFPALIHEITLEAALDLELLAPLRVWVAEVDADASQVRVLAGDYDEASLGRVMSAAPFFRAVEVFRYHLENRHRPALIACATRQQAFDLRRYLTLHRPSGAPPPALILGDTPAAARELGLSLFEQGEIDTLIQVGVLIEGWSSPRCKLLIDLAPSLSRVHATQKYFRVMTRLGETEARIYVLLPTRLPEWPILPNELFGPSYRSYECGHLLGKARQRTGGALDDLLDGADVAGVQLKKRILLTTTLARPRLRRDQPADIRSVVRSCPAFDPARPCGVFAFRGLWFEHALFRGSGEFLLRWLGVPPTRAAYMDLLARVVPDAAGTLLLQEGGASDAPWCREDRRVLRVALREGAPSAEAAEAFRGSWRALTGREDHGPVDPETCLLLREQRQLIGHALSEFNPRERWIVARSFGLLGERARTADDIGADLEVTLGRVRQVVLRSLKRLRQTVRRDDWGIDVCLLLRQGWTPPVFSRKAPPPSVRPANALEATQSRLPFWDCLPCPVTPQQLLPLLSALFERLGDRLDAAAAKPTFHSWLEDGVSHAEARWEAGAQMVELLRHGHAAPLHEGGEEVIEGLWARVSGLHRGTQLLLAGPLGHFDRFVLEGSGARAISATWRTVVSQGTGL